MATRPAKSLLASQDVLIICNDRWILLAVILIAITCLATSTGKDDATTITDNVHLTRGFPGVRPGKSLSRGEKNTDAGYCIFPPHIRDTNFLWDSLHAKNAFHSEVVYLNETSLLGQRGTDIESRKVSKEWPPIVRNDAIFDIPAFFCRYHLPSHVIETFRYHELIDHICISNSSSKTERDRDRESDRSGRERSIQRAAFFTDMMNLALTDHRGVSSQSSRRMVTYHNVFVNKYGLIVNPHDCTFVRNGGCWFMNHTRIFFAKLEYASRPQDKKTMKVVKSSSRSKRGQPSPDEIILGTVRQRHLLRSDSSGSNRRLELIERDNDRERESILRTHKQKTNPKSLSSILSNILPFMSTTTKNADHDQANSSSSLSRKSHSIPVPLSIADPTSSLFSSTKSSAISLAGKVRNTVTSISTSNDADVTEMTEDVPTDYYDVSHLSPISFANRSASSEPGSESASGQDRSRSSYYDRMIALTAGAVGTWHFPMEVLVALAAVDEEIVQTSYILVTQPNYYVTSWLALVGIRRHQIIYPKTKGGFMAKTLLVPEMGRCAEPSFTQLQWLRQLAGLPLDRHLITSPSQQKPERDPTVTPTVVYLQRMKSRTIANGHEVKETVLAFTKRYHWNFVLHHEEHMPSLREQIRRFSQADIIIGPHGAGLLFSVFAPAHACVIEIMPDIRPECFARIAYLRQLHYILHVTDQVTLPETSSGGSMPANTNMTTTPQQIFDQVNVTEIAISLERCRHRLYSSGKFELN